MDWERERVGGRLAYLIKRRSEGGIVNITADYGYIAFMVNLDTYWKSWGIGLMLDTEVHPQEDWIAYITSTILLGPIYFKCSIDFFKTKNKE